MIKLKDLITEGGKPKKGDYVKGFTGEVGQVNKVSGKIAYVKYQSSKGKFWPADWSKWKEGLPSFIKGKLHKFWIEK